MTAPALFPDYATPADLARHFGVSERTVREKVRVIGAFGMLGRKMVLFPEHVEKFTEAMKCPSSFTGAAQSGTTAGRLPEGDFAALQKRLTEKRPNRSRRKPSTKLGNVVSMDRGRG